MVHALGHPLNLTHVKILGSAYMPSSKLSTLSHGLDPWYTRQASPKAQGKAAVLSMVGPTQDLGQM